MRNLQVATALAEMAVLLELQGANTYKVRAYKRAAAILQSLPVDVATLIHDNEIQNVPGIGKALGAKIIEHIQTGRIEALERLRLQIPPRLSEVLQVPGIGPHTASQLHTQLGVRDLASLQQVVASGRLQQVKGIGEKTERSIQRSLAQLAKQSGSWPLGEALAIANELVSEMQKCPHQQQVAIAGSVRRMQETVENINLVVATNSPVALSEWCLRSTIVAQLRQREETTLSVSLHNGMLVNLHMVAPACFASALQHFTGSYQHNADLQQLAAEQGKYIDVEGVTDKRNGQRIVPTSEEHLYQILGLPYIAPELRQGQGEIVAALQNNLPMLVQQTDIHGDLHVHSLWSDGTLSLRDIARAAAARGLSYLAVCDHSPHVAVAGGLTPERLVERNKEIDQVNQEGHGARLLAGTEVDILADGTLDYPDEVLATCDVVVASLHTNLQQDGVQIMHRLRSAMSNPYVHIIGHPSARFFRRRPSVELDYNELISQAKMTGTVLEINSNPRRMDLSAKWARQAATAGVYLAINSDAHDEEELNLLYGVSVARRAWLEPMQVVNCLSLNELKQFLAQKRV